MVIRPIARGPCPLALGAAILRRPQHLAQPSRALHLTQHGRQQLLHRCNLASIRRYTAHATHSMLKAAQNVVKRVTRSSLIGNPALWRGNPMTLGTMLRSCVTKAPGWGEGSSAAIKFVRGIAAPSALIVAAHIGAHTSRRSGRHTADMEAAASATPAYRPPQLAEVQFFQAPLALRMTSAFIRFLVQFAEFLFLRQAAMTGPVELVIAAVACLAFRLLTYLRSQDPGKFLTSLYIMDKEGQPLVWWKAAMRDVARLSLPFVGPLLAAADFFGLVYNKDNDTHRDITDLLFETSVVVGVGFPGRTL